MTGFVVQVHKCETWHLLNEQGNLDANTSRCITLLQVHMNLILIHIMTIYAYYILYNVIICL